MILHPVSIMDILAESAQPSSVSPVANGARLISPTVVGDAEAASPIMDHGSLVFELGLLMEGILHHLGCINPVNHGINYLSTGAGFQPSTG